MQQRRGRILSQAENATGHRFVHIYGRKRYVHRLVLEAFVGTCPDLHEGCHRDGDPRNNTVVNLYWGTRSANNYDKVRHGTDHNSCKTHCKHGHEFTPENTAFNRRGNRQCIACGRIRASRMDSR